MSNYENPVSGASKSEWEELGLTKEEWDAFVEQMDEMSQDEPTEEDVAAMYDDYLRTELSELDTPVEMLEYVQENGVPLDHPAVRDSFQQWFPGKLSAIQDDHQMQRDVADMDKQVFDGFGENYGFALPAYEAQRLSASYDPDISYEERMSLIDASQQEQIEQAVWAAAEAQARLQSVSGNLNTGSVQLYSGATLDLLNQHHYADILKSAQDYVQDANKCAGQDTVSFGQAASAELKEQNQLLRSAFLGMSDNLDHMSGRHKAGTVPVVPVTDRLRFNASLPMQNSGEQPVRERNDDRLPKTNNYKPKDVSVYNRAIPNDGWSFDEYDRDEKPTDKFLASEAAENLDAPDEPDVSRDRTHDSANNPYDE